MWPVTKGPAAPPIAQAKVTTPKVAPCALIPNNSATSGDHKDMKAETAKPKIPANK